MKSAQSLAAKHIIGQSRLAFLENLTDAHNGSEFSLKRCFEFQIDGIIGLSEILPALGVPYDHVRTAEGEKHAAGDFACERTFLFPVDVLGANGDRGAHRRLDRSR